MKKFRILAIVAVLIAVLIPVAVNAGGVFYCSTNITSGGSGSYYNPWACSTAAQLDYVIDDRICDIYHGGYLYQIFTNSYRYNIITWYSADNCRVTYSADYTGYPPYTGVEVPVPIIIGVVALVGTGMLVAGLALRRKKNAV
jgi:hypothetical protein